MIIEYIYIENYKNILKKVDINFGSNKRYTYVGKGRIKCEVNYKYVSNMYNEYSNIENISAIVGKNGVGKTTVLRLINDIFRKKSKIKYIIIYSRNNKRYIYGNLNEELDVKDLDARIIHNINGNFILDGGNPVNIIYFSSVFDKNRRLTDNKFLRDISTNEMIKRIPIKNNENFIDIITEFRRKEIPNILLLLNDLYETNINNFDLLFEIPPIVEIRVKKNKYNATEIKANNFYDYKFIDNYENNINKICDSFCNRFNRSYKKQIYIEFLLNIPMTIFINADQSYNISLFEEIKEIKENLDIIIKNILNYDRPNKLILAIRKLNIEYIDKIIYKINEEIDDLKNYSYDVIEYLDENLKVLNSLVSNLMDILDYIDEELDEDKYMSNTSNIVSTDNIAEVCFFIKEIDELIEKIKDNHKMQADSTNTSYEDILNEELSLIIDDDFDDSYIKEKSQGTFYDYIMILDNEEKLQTLDDLSIIEILNDIKYKTRDVYDTYLKNIFRSNKEREVKLNRLNKIVEFKSELNQYYALIKTMDYIINDRQIRNKHFNIGDVYKDISISIKLDDLKFKNLIRIYSNLTLKKDILSFDWHNLSSGQNAYLDMISRIYMLVREKSITESIEDIILLIDEGDLYLHPSAQIQFVQNLMNFINKFLENKKVQFIMTTNSPFIVSDIKNDNIIYLTLDNGQVKVDKSKNELLTFGANVNELLIDTFYMENGTKGVFSTNKINLIKDLLRLENESFTDAIIKNNIEMCEIKNIIESIGEEVVRKRLLELYIKKENTLFNKTNENINKIFNEFSNLNNYDKRVFLERILNELK